MLDYVYQCNWTQSQMHNRWIFYGSAQNCFDKDSKYWQKCQNIKKNYESFSCNGSYDNFYATWNLPRWKFDVWYWIGFGILSGRNIGFGVLNLGEKIWLIFG